MEKVIYDNENSKLVAEASGGVVELTQYLEGEDIGSVFMYYEEVSELLDYLKEIDEEE